MKSSRFWVWVSSSALLLGCGSEAFTSGTGGTSNANGNGNSAGSGNSSGGSSNPNNPGNGGAGSGLAGASSLGGSSAAIACTESADCDDSNPCTSDSCGPNGFCAIRPNSDPCETDDNDCTEDKCAGGICIHPATTDPCVDDGDECTGDVCNGGFCTHPSTGQCDCNSATDCDDSNPCTDDSCDAMGQCQYQDNADPCADDNNECTNDLCSAGSCMHENSTGDCTDDGVACTLDVCAQGVCTHPGAQCPPMPLVVKILGNTLMMDAMRTFVRVNEDGYLVFGAGPDQAELFEVTPAGATTIVLRAMSTGHFVGIDLNNNDYIIANVSSIDEASDFDNAPCGPATVAGAACGTSCRVLQALDDDDNESFVAAEPTCPNSGPCVAMGLRARSPACSASQYSWEAWEFIVQ